MCENDGRMDDHPGFDPGRLAGLRVLYRPKYGKDSRNMATV
jgi:hypothetical protein